LGGPATFFFPSVLPPPSLRLPGWRRVAPHVVAAAVAVAAACCCLLLLLLLLVLAAAAAASAARLLCCSAAVGMPVFKLNAC